MGTLRRFVPALLIFAFLAAPSRASAEPVRITSGFLTVDGLGATGFFQLTGLDFDISGGAEPGVVGPEFNCTPCASGDSIDLSTRYLGDIGSGSGTVNGTFYSQLTFANSMSFLGPTVLAPSTPGPFTVVRPFSFDASLLGIVDHNQSTERTVFDATLFGNGIVTASFFSVPTEPGATPLFSFDSVRYDFTAAEPVPEPATLMLLGSGLAAIASRHVSRRRRRSDSSTC
jgi:hypothetical protein